MADYEYAYDRVLYVDGIHEGTYDINNGYHQAELGVNAGSLASAIQTAIPAWMTFKVRCSGTACLVMADEVCPDVPLLDATVATYKAYTGA